MYLQLVLTLNYLYRYKTIKERNSKTGNSRYSWRYFALMDDMYRGDPAVTPVAPVSSLLNVDEQPNDPSQSEDTGRANEVEAETTCTPNMTPQRKRKRPNDIEPAWVADYRADLKSMHDEKMQIDRDRLDLEARRVNSLERLVKLLENKSD